ncbi:hypothetical protein HXX76_006599 [Chlamydomonas incerta]|uniref:Phosphodiesterase n=1 Tax=Chlamydomonas incerta TaxID=51695 RepID=A0A835W3U9_CHLIN|nr:hypothetical protein HXX76_006599 [Chlamydomonas incerta]|eukprot:KAG2436288.1 hypothetical protein HXX76_006599 [Chlamydomonas incerta]
MESATRANGRGHTFRSVQQRVRVEATSLWRIVREYPSTAVAPLVILVLVLGFGLWGVDRVAQSEADSSRSRAEAAAVNAAGWVQQRVSVAVAPVMLLTALVETRPDYVSAAELFTGMAPALHAQTPVGSLRRLLLAPAGVIRNVFPIQGNERAVGLDLLNGTVSGVPQRYSGIVAAVQARGVTMNGPYALLNGGIGIGVNAPIFVPAASPAQRFGEPDTVSSYCGAPCAYNVTAGLAFWGLAGVVIDVAALVGGDNSPLQPLAAAGYRFRLTAPQAPVNMRQVAGAGGEPVDPVEVPVQLPNNVWVLSVSPDDGPWRPTWYGGLVAAVVVVAVALSAMMFAALVSRRKHEQLLKALLPQEMIDTLKSTSVAQLGPAIVRTDTPADVLLRMMADLLSGHMPPTRDVVFIRTALLRNMDVYQPLNLHGQIKGANLDTDVMQALMKQLGAVPGGIEFSMDDDHDRPGGSGGAIIINPTDLGDGLGGGGMWGLTDDDTTATNSLYMSRTMTPPHGHTYNFDTLSGALAALLAPPPALLLPPSLLAAQQQAQAQAPSQAQAHLSLQLQLQYQLQQQVQLHGGGHSNSQLMVLGARDAGGSHGQMFAQHPHQHQPLQSSPLVKQATIHAAAAAAAAAAGPGTAQADVSESAAPLSSAARDNLLLPAAGCSGGSAGGGLLAAAVDAVAAQLAKQRSAGSTMSVYSRAPSAALGAAANVPPAAPLQPSLLSGGAGLGTPGASGRLARVVVTSASAAAGVASPTPISVCTDAGDPSLAVESAAAGGTGLSSAATAHFDCLPTGGLSALVNSPSEAALMASPPAAGSPHQQPPHAQQRPPSAPASQARPRSSLKAAVLALGAAVVGSGRRTAAGDLASSSAAGSTAPVFAPPAQPLSPVAASGPLPVSPTHNQGHFHTHSTYGTGSGAGAVLPMAHMMVAPPPPPPPVIEEVERLLAQADGWQFNTWQLAEATGGRALSCLGFFLLQREGLIDKFKIKRTKLARLLLAVEQGYPSNPYHNATHAADVLQTLHVLLQGASLVTNYVDRLGLLAAYFAAIIHDHGHPGLTNDFLVATCDVLAVRYNDRSPLENHHAASAFALLLRPEYDITSQLSTQEKAAFRKQVIDMVLATDMKQHFAILSHFKTVHRLGAYTPGSGGAAAHGAPGGARAPAAAAARNSHEDAPAAGNGKEGAAKRANSQTSPGPGGANGGGTARRASALILDSSTAGANINGGTRRASACGLDSSMPAPVPVDETERLLTLQVALKVADIGHLGESLPVHERWLGVLEEEFFSQGDRERALGLPISPLFDRAKQGVSKSQVGFYDFVALPLVHALASAFPGARPLMESFVANYDHWRAVEARQQAANALLMSTQGSILAMGSNGGGPAGGGGGDGGGGESRGGGPTAAAAAAAAAPSVKGPKASPRLLGIFTNSNGGGGGGGRGDGAPADEEAGSGSLGGMFAQEVRGAGTNRRAPPVVSVAVAVDGQRQRPSPRV